MTLIYRFNKERLENGRYVSRPRILVDLRGPKDSVIVSALIDSGCDTTVIPEGIAKTLGLNMNGAKDKLYAYHESTDVIKSTVTITFLGKEHRQSVTLAGIPVLIALAKRGDKKKGDKDEEDITLGVDGIFDAFEITFKKLQNKIIFKKATKHLFP